MSDFDTSSAIKVDGLWRGLGCQQLMKASSYPSFFESFESAQSQPISEIDLSEFANRIMDQGQTSSCVGQASAAAMEIAWRQAGNNPLEFSPWFVYSQINNNRDNGANIGDALEVMQDSGIAPRSTIPTVTLWKKNIPQIAYTEATRYKVFKAFDCNGYEEVLAAINLGFPVVLGIYVPSSFSNVNSEGVPPVTGWGGGGHAMCGVGIKKSSKYGWMIKTQNSWGTRFGMNGYCNLIKQHFGSNGYGCFAVQALKDDPKDDTNDVPVVVA